MMDNVKGTITIMQFRQKTFRKGFFVYLNIFLNSFCMGWANKGMILE
jgi:hypothetical protein